MNVGGGGEKKKKCFNSIIHSWINSLLPPTPGEYPESKSVFMRFRILCEEALCLISCLPFFNSSPIRRKHCSKEIVVSICGKESRVRAEE
jgi:hypothetical protein